MRRDDDDGLYVTWPQLAKVCAGIAICAWVVFIVTWNLAKWLR
jgi:hypothetical protein